MFFGCKFVFVPFLSFDVWIDKHHFPRLIMPHVSSYTPRWTEYLVLLSCLWPVFPFDGITLEVPNNAFPLPGFRFS